MNEESSANSHRFGFFIKDDISIFRKFIIQPGVRLDFPTNINKAYFQPRINATYHISKNWKFNLSAGIYNQFITKNAVIDNFDDYLYVWNIANTETILVLSAEHYTAGITFNKTFFKFSIEGFYKKINNISLFRLDYETEELNFNTGKSKIAGLDFYLKLKLKKHECWLAYTLSQTVEHYSYFTDNNFSLAPHNQTHELKGAVVLNSSPFFISLNYVYGSGLEFTKNYENKLIPYSRLDFAVLYKLKIKKTNIDFGLSALNLLDTENVKYNNFINMPNNNEIVYSEAIPFTPIVSIRFHF